MAGYTLIDRDGQETRPGRLLSGAEMRYFLAVSTAEAGREVSVRSDDGYRITLRGPDELRLRAPGEHDVERVLTGAPPELALEAAQLVAAGDGAEVASRFGWRARPADDGARAG